MGFPFHQFFGALTSLAPVVLMLVPGGQVLAPFVPVIVKTIADIELRPGITGPNKRAFVQQAVADAAAATNLVHPNTVDVPLIVDAAGHYVDAVIGSINSVQTARQALPAVPTIVSAIVPHGTIATSNSQVG